MARIQEYNVAVGDSVMIEGYVAFSRIASPITGEELRRENERRKNNGMIQANGQFWSISLNDPTIIYKSGDPSQPTPFEHFWATEKIFDKRTGGKGTSAEKKGTVEPKLFQLDANMNAKPLTLSGELAAGSKVRIIVGVYQASMGMGYGFDTVLVMDDPVKYFESNNASRSLANYGIVINNDAGPVETVATTEEDVQEPAQAAPQPQAEPQSAVTPEFNPFNQPSPGNAFNNTPFNTNK